MSRVLVQTMRLNNTESLLTDIEYPTTTGEIIETHGSERLELANGNETLGDVLSRAGEETFRSSSEAYDAVLNGVSHRAIGRRFYSDRDPTTLGEDGPVPLSF